MTTLDEKWKQATESGDCPEEGCGGTLRLKKI